MNDKASTHTHAKQSIQWFFSENNNGTMNDEAGTHTHTHAKQNIQCVFSENNNGTMNDKAGTHTCKTKHSVCFFREQQWDNE